MHAVVIAAGLGTRLRPLTEHYAKPVLPVDGRPVLATLLRELEAAGLREVTVVVGHLGHQVRRLAGDGSAFGLALRYAEQDGPHGSAHAVAAASPAPPYLVLGADTVFARGDLGRFAAAFGASGAAGAVAVWPEPGGVVRLEGDAVRELGEAGGTHAAAPLWAVGAALAPLVAALDGPPPHGLATAFQQAVDAGERVVGIPVARPRDLTSPLDLLVENFPYLEDLSDR